jgi:hypothetical protein
MTSLRFSRASLPFVLLTILLSTVLASAKNGRDFAGHYKVSSAVEQGDQMVVTFRFQIFNHSDADLKGAVVKLHSQEPGLAEAQLSRPVKLWKNHGEVRLTQQFTVSKREFERWSHGSQPALFVVYRDGQGQRWERFVQMSPQKGLPD